MVYQVQDWCKISPSKRIGPITRPRNLLPTQQIVWHPNKIHYPIISIVTIETHWREEPVRYSFLDNLQLGVSWTPGSLLFFSQLHITESNSDSWRTTLSAKCAWILCIKAKGIRKNCIRKIFIDTKGVCISCQFFERFHPLSVSILVHHCTLTRALITLTLCSPTVKWDYTS